jgi:(R,R)-butanediol dehydrogenase/meso-butanediol dehydrogenase/diacetyl reductase
MRVAMFHGAGRPITIEDVADDPLPSGSVRIAVGRCGICGSDVSMTSGSPFDYAAGSRLGHESAGTVIELGKGVSRLRLGDRVSVLPRGFCGGCVHCRAGRPLFCTTGPNQTGGFGERLVITETSGFRFPASVTMGEGALAEPIACGRRAMRMARLQPGDSLLVLGAGSMGLAAIYWARRLGAGRIVVATRTPARHATALAMGADVAVSTGGDDPDALARAMPEPADIVVEAAGKPGMVMAAAEQARLGGTVLSLGMCPSADHVVPALNTFRELSILFPLGYSPEDFTETLRAFDADAIRAGAMIGETLPLDRLPALIEQMRGPHDHLKTQIAP